MKKLLKVAAPSPLRSHVIYEATSGIEKKKFTIFLKKITNSQQTQFILAKIALQLLLSNTSSNQEFVKSQESFLIANYNIIKQVNYLILNAELQSGREF